MIPEDWQSPEWLVDWRQPHRWHNYVSKTVQQLWGSFTDEQKKALAAGFEEVAMNEVWD